MSKLTNILFELVYLTWAHFNFISNSISGIFHAWQKHKKSKCGGFGYLQVAFKAAPARIRFVLSIRLVFSNIRLQRRRVVWVEGCSSTSQWFKFFLEFVICKNFWPELGFAQNFGLKFSLFRIFARKTFCWGIFFRILNSVPNFFHRLHQQSSKG